MIASGRAASTASTLTVGAGSVCAAKTLTPPHSAIACEMRWVPPIVYSGAFQTS